MNIFDNLVLPISSEHLHFYHVLLIIALLLFLSYSAVFFGSALISVVFRTIGRNEDRPWFKRLAQDYVDNITANRLSGIGLGLVPFLAVIMFYTQLLHKADAGIVSYLVISLILYIPGWLAIYTYRRTLHLDNVFTTLKKSAIEIENEPDIREFLGNSESNSRLNVRSGYWGVILLFISIWIFIGCFTLAGDTSRMKITYNVFGSVFYMTGFVKFIHYLTAALATTCGFYIFIKYYSDSSKRVKNMDEYETFARRLSVTIALILTLVQPFFFIAAMILTPRTGLSYSLFIVTIVALAIVMAASHFLYGNLKLEKRNFISYSFYSLILIIGFFIVQQQLNFDFSNRGQELLLATNYNKVVQEEMEKMGRATSRISGAEVYQTRCMPCHRFDQKIVGPPYNEVLGDYVGKKADLVKFILNPDKTRPGYPQMPNPGLKPPEAEAVADFLLQTYQKSHGGGGAKQ